MEGRAEPALSEVGWVAPVSVAMTVHASPIWKSPPRLNPVRQLGPTRRGEVGHPLAYLLLIWTRARYVARDYFCIGPSGSTVLPNNSLSTCASPV